MASFDLIVLGGGPAGYTGAIRAAQLGLNTAIIDKGEVLGGTCLNIGCIPSKALLLSSDHFHFAQHQAARHGLKFEKVSFDLAQMMKRKQEVVRQLTQGLEFLMKKNKITRLFGVGEVVAPGKVVLTMKDGKQEELQGKHVVLATGSVPMELPNIRIDRQTVVTSDEALSFDQVPNELVVIGAGAIGLELGSVWARLGAKVTIIEFLPRIAAFFDPDVTQILQKALESENVKFHLETTVTSVAVENGIAKVEAVDKEKQKLQFSADKVLVAVGRKPYLDGAVAKDLGLKLTSVVASASTSITERISRRSTPSEILSTGRCSRIREKTRVWHAWSALPEKPDMLTMTRSPMSSIPTLRWRESASPKILPDKKGLRSRSANSRLSQMAGHWPMTKAWVSRKSWQTQKPINCWERKLSVSVPLN